MSRFALDDSLARSVATDTANRNMRRDGRCTWNREDLNIAASTYNHLLLRSAKEHAADPVPTSRRISQHAASIAEKGGRA